MESNGPKQDGKPDKTENLESSDKSEGRHNMVVDLASTTYDNSVWVASGLSRAAVASVYNSVWAAKQVGNAVVTTANCSLWAVKQVGNAFLASPVAVDMKRMGNTLYEDYKENGTPGQKTLETASMITEEWGGATKVGAKVGGLLGIAIAGPVGAMSGGVFGALVGSAAEGAKDGTSVDKVANCIVEKTLPKKQERKNVALPAAKTTDKYDALVESYATIANVPEINSKL